MKRTKTIGQALIAGSLGLAVTGNAQLVKPNTLGNDYRVAQGYSGNADESHRLQTTVGIAPKGEYYNGTIPARGQFYDVFRLYDVTSLNTTDNTHNTFLGAKSPSFSVGSLENRALVFGGFGDTQGLGIETEHTFDKKVILTLNAEQRGDSDQNRLGGSLSYNVTDTTRIGFAYDSTSNDGLLTKQYFANVVSDVTAKDSLGIAFFSRNNTDASTTQGIGAFWTQYADKANWGTFAHLHADWNEKRDERSFSGELFVAQKPTTSKYGGSWTVGRSVRDDEQYNLSVVPLSVSLTESIRLFDRSGNGFSTSLRGGISSASGAEQGYIGGGVGYIYICKPLKGRLGASLETQYGFSQHDSMTTLEPNIIYRGFHPKGLWGITAGAVIPLTHDQKPTLRTAVQVVW